MVRRITAAILFAAHITDATASGDIPALYVAKANDHGVDQCLLYAIALQESPKKIHESKVMPWPWTLNHAGTPYYFSTQRELIQKVRALESEGHTSFDVGPTQVNWRYHKEKYHSIEDATDPRSSIAAAAEFISTLKKKNPKAGALELAGLYHRPAGGPFAEKYMKEIKIRFKENKPNECKDLI